jgi:hypothetical protein
METLYQLNRKWRAVDDFVQLLRRCKYDISKGAAELKTLYLMIPYCRDVIRGKGERDLAYRMIYAFYQVFPVLAIKALHLLFCVRDGLPMVGSWCDVKYFCVFVERISPLGAADPLIAIMASIANKNIDDSSVAKWIPRECHHRELFSVFSKDFFHISPGRVFSSVKKGLYRKRVSGPKGPIDPTDLKESKGPSGTWFMGKYVCEAIRLVKGGTLTGEPVEAIEGRWRRLLKTFPCSIMNGLPIVDLDIGIPDDVLFHSIGFACLIAEKMGLKRIMLAGTTSTWVDISRCSGFVETVRVLWSFCEVRGVSCLREAVELVDAGFKYVFDGSLIVFIFSERFSFDWRSLILRNRCVPVFWNMGNTFEIPHDLYVGPEDEAVNFIYMSGYASGLLMPFFSAETRVHEFYRGVLESYSEWSAYFDLFISNVVEATQEIPNSLSLGQI